MYRFNQRYNSVYNYLFMKFKVITYKDIEFVMMDEFVNVSRLFKQNGQSYNKWVREAEYMDDVINECERITGVEECQRVVNEPPEWKGVYVHHSICSYYCLAISHELTIKINLALRETLSNKNADPSNLQ